MGCSRATVVLGAVSLLGIAEMALAQTEPPAAPTAPTTSGKERAATAAATSTEKAQAPSKEKKFSMCLETWDAQTHMTKREWRVACLRSVRDYPDAFDR